VQCGHGLIFVVAYRGYDKIPVPVRVKPDGIPIITTQNADAVAAEIFMPDLRVSPCRGMQRLVNIPDEMKQEFEGKESFVVRGVWVLQLTYELVDLVDNAIR